MTDENVAVGRLLFFDRRHDGSLKTLEEVVDFYDEGGTENPHQDPRMFPRNFTDEEKEALLEFLRSLTGDYPSVEAPELPR